MGIWGYQPIFPFSQEFEMSEESKKPISEKKLIVLGGLIVGLPVVLVVVGAIFFLNSGMATADSGDHQLVVKLQAEIAQQNATIQNISNFLVNQQIPFDQQVLNYTHTHK